jgi:hypothetical protein
VAAAGVGGGVETMAALGVSGAAGPATAADLG